MWLTSEVRILQVGSQEDTKGHRKPPNDGFNYRKVTTMF
jgi:hypothetical protein